MLSTDHKICGTTPHIKKKNPDREKKKKGLIYRMKAVLAAYLVLVFCISGAQSTTFNFVNKCQQTIWPASLANSGSPQLSNTGFVLNQGATVPISPPTAWSGRFWGRTGCTTDASGKFTCETGDCGSGQVSCNGKGGSPPATLVEVTLNGNGDNTDTYDISLVDGFNLPVNIVPSQSSCTTSSCSANVNSACPAQLQQKGSKGDVIGCKSACLAFNTPETCCLPPDHDTTATCGPTQYATYFKQQCPQAYSYAKDDTSSTFSCPSGANYTITFCP